MSAMGEVLSVHAYPFKGAQAATIDGNVPTELIATPAGFQAGDFFDREYFAAAETDNGLVIVTPRGWEDDQGPKVVHKTDRALAALAVNISQGGTTLELGSGSRSLHISRPEQDPDEPGPDPLRVRIHGGTVLGIAQGELADEFISDVIGRKARLLRAPLRAARRTLSNGSPTRAHAADGFPYLIVNQPTLDALNKREGMEIPISRYRGNIVVDLKEPAVEDVALLVEVANQWFRVASASGRCIVTNLDKQGQVAGGGLRVLRSRKGYQQLGAFSSEDDIEGVFFGDNADLLASFGDSRMVKVGQMARVLAYTSSHVRFEE